MHYCRRCGTLIRNIKHHIFACDNGHTIYLNASPTAGVFILCDDDTEILLSVRGIEPNKGMLDSFGGFLDGAESFEEAAIRELQEELALHQSDYEALRYLTSSPSTYEYDGEVHTVVTVFFWTRLLPSAAPKPSDDVAEIFRSPINDVPLDRLHSQDIEAGVTALQKLVITSRGLSAEDFATL